MAIPNPAFNPDEEDNLDIPEHLFIRKRKVRLSRSAFAAVCSLVLAGVFAWCAGWLRNEGGLWVLSGGVGALYGALFTLTVSQLGPLCCMTQAWVLRVQGSYSC